MDGWQTIFCHPKLTLLVKYLNVPLVSVSSWVIDFKHAELFLLLSPVVSKLSGKHSSDLILVQSYLILSFSGHISMHFPTRAPPLSILFRSIKPHLFLSYMATSQRMTFDPVPLYVYVPVPRTSDSGNAVAWPLTLNWITNKIAGMPTLHSDWPSHLGLRRLSRVFLVLKIISWYGASAAMVSVCSLGLPGYRVYRVRRREERRVSGGGRGETHLRPVERPVRGKTWVWVCSEYMGCHALRGK